MSGAPAREPVDVVRHLVPSKLVERIERGEEIFVVTGATGWFGTATLHILDEALGAASERRLRAFASAGRAVELRTGRSIDVQPLSELPGLDLGGERVCVLHFAYLMRHLAQSLGTAEFVRQNRDITAIMLTALDRLRPAAFCFASSGAVYRRGGGFVDDLEHDPYATLKREDEVAFERHCRALDSRFILGRIYSVGGPFMPDRDRFVLGDLVDRARAGEPLVIRAQRELWRSYTAVGDVLALFLAEALDGDEASVIFETGGEVVEAAELAEIVRRVLGRPELAIERALEPGAAPDHYVGDGASFERLLARHGIAPTSLEDQIRQVSRA